MTSLQIAMDITERDHLILLELKKLLKDAPAGQLRKSIEDFMFSYLSEGGVVLPSREMVCHFYFLMHFLREVE